MTQNHEITHVTQISHFMVKKNSSAYLVFVTPKNNTFYTKRKLKMKDKCFEKSQMLHKSHLFLGIINIRPFGLPNDEITHVTPITHVMVPFSLR